MPNASSFDIMNPLFRNAVDTKLPYDFAASSRPVNAVGATGEILSFLAHIGAIICAVTYLRNTHDKAYVPFYVPFVVPFITSVFGVLTGRKKTIHDVMFTAAQLSTIAVCCWYWTLVSQSDKFAYQYLLLVFFTIMAL